ncbi:Uma2 family endonuclease [Streptomyces sp. JJ36]|uniref:Uma2 family endonuclease n=1 Tax=Streptomyces sp. JJ36 TaxID=2736645 RepID=UPI001F44CD97|nr:Uma2 family endonuclease [Streptomyces sp. JJ36]MCF6524278.1 Uma2 family endonuclease [Streptomyces sp. JJ36]
MTRFGAGRRQMTVGEFEELARSSPETVTLELISGKLEVKPVPDGSHGAIRMWLLTRFLHRRPDLRLYPGQGLRTGSRRQDRARPDGALAPEDHFAGQGEWAEPEGVLMAVEITSRDSDTDRRDRREKRDGYAAAGIPVYLLVDREDCSVSVYSEPRDGAYRRLESSAYGKPVHLPEPVGVTLETEKLKG